MRNVLFGLTILVASVALAQGKQSSQGDFSKVSGADWRTIQLADQPQYEGSAKIRLMNEQDVPEIPYYSVIGRTEHPAELLPSPILICAGALVLGILGSRYRKAD